MANVVDTKLYDILGVPPGASENELKKVAGSAPGGRGVRGAGLRGRGGQAALRGGPRAGAGRDGPRLGRGGEPGLPRGRAPRPRLTLGRRPRPPADAANKTHPCANTTKSLPSSRPQRAPGTQPPGRPSPRRGHHPGKTGRAAAPGASRPGETGCARRGRRRRGRVGPVRGPAEGRVAAAPPAPRGGRGCFLGAAAPELLPPGRADPAAAWVCVGAPCPAGRRAGGSRPASGRSRGSQPDT